MKVAINQAVDRKLTGILLVLMLDKIKYKPV